MDGFHQHTQHVGGYWRTNPRTGRHEFVAPHKREVLRRAPTPSDPARRVGGYDISDLADPDETLDRDRREERIGELVPELDGLTRSMWANFGVEPRDVAMLHGHGIDAVTAKSYLEGGIAARDIPRWQAAGVDGQAARTLGTWGVTDVDEAREMIRADPLIPGYLSFGVRERRTYQMLHDAGLNPGDLDSFQRVGVTNPHRMIELVDDGVRPRDVYAWAHVYRVEDPAEWAALARNDISPGAYGVYRQAGAGSVREVLALRRAGVVSQHAEDFSLSGVHSPADMMMLAERGATPRDLYRWRTEHGVFGVDAIVERMNVEQAARQRARVPWWRRLLTRNA